MKSFFFNDTATTEIYTLSLHDALPISGRVASLDFHLLVGDHELLGEDAGVAGLEGADLEALGPRVGQLVALDRGALEVVHDDRAALAGVAHLPELRVLGPC